MSSISKMLLLSLLIVLGSVIFPSAAPHALWTGVTPAWAQDQGDQGDQGGQGTQGGGTDLTVDVTTRETTTWYANPLWIGLGVLAAIVVIALIVMASRSGGGTTIVHE